MERGFITNIFAILAVLIIVLISQSVFFRPIIKNIFSQGQGIKEKIPYANTIGDWFADKVYNPLTRMSGEVAGQADALQDTVQKEIVEQKNNLNDLQETSVNATKKFIAEKFLQALGVAPQDLLTQEELSKLSCPK